MSDPKLQEAYDLLTLRLAVWCRKAFVDGNTGEAERIVHCTDALDEVLSEYSDIRTDHERFESSVA